MMRAAAERDRRPRAVPARAPARALMSETLELTAEAQRLGAAARWSSRRTTAAPSSRACSTGTRASRPSSPTCRSSSTTCRSARRSTSRPRPSAGCAARTTTSSASRRRRATSSTSPTCSNECGTRLHRAVRASSCSATRCSCSAARGHLSCVGNFAPRPVAELYDAFVAGDHERARALHYDLHPLVDAAFVGDQPGAREVGHGAARPAAVRRSRASRSRRSSEASSSASLELLARAARRLPVALARGRWSSAPLPGAEALDRAAACVARAAPRSRRRAHRVDEQLDQLAVLGDRLGAAVRDLDEDGAADRVEPARDVAQHRDERRVRAALVDDRVELLVEAAEA